MWKTKLTHLSPHLKALALRIHSKHLTDYKDVTANAKHIYAASLQIQSLQIKIVPV
jgi:hypothetical protein